MKAPSFRRACLAVLWLVSATAHSQTAVFEYTTNLSINGQVAEDKVLTYVADPSLVPLDTTLADPTGSARARSFAGYGVNKALTQLSAPDAANPLFLGYTLATSTWRDRVTISDPQLDGTPGVFTATMLVNGAGFFAPAASWMESADVNVLGQWISKIEVVQAGGIYQDNTWFGAWVKDPSTGSMVYVGSELNTFQQEASFSFVYGQPFALGGLLQTYLSLDNFQLVPGTLDATLDLGNSAYWAGMTVRDANGNPVVGASIVSDSGIDWRLAVGPAAVPEPATAPLMLAALGLLAWKVKAWAPRQRDWRRHRAG